MNIRKDHHSIARLRRTSVSGGRALQVLAAGYFSRHFGDRSAILWLYAVPECAAKKAPNARRKSTGRARADGISSRTSETLRFVTLPHEQEIHSKRES